MEQDKSNLIDICIVGSACVDFFFEVNDFPLRGETISAKTYFNAAGGKGANQAVAAAKLQGVAIFAGQLGNDDAGRQVVREMEEAGVDMQHHRKLGDAKTALGFITLTPSGENNIIIVGGANTHYDNFKELPGEYINAIDRSKIILLQREIPQEINILVAKYAHSKGKTVVLDLGGRDEPFSDELLQNIDFISPNETELEKFIGHGLQGDVEGTIRRDLLVKYPHLKVLLKLGVHGCAVITKGLHIKCGNITTFNSTILKDYTVVDVTGAGDCLMGSFFVRYSQLLGTVPEEELYERCMKFGNLAAFLSITTKGAMPAMPNAKAVQDFHSKYISDLKI